MFTPQSVIKLLSGINLDEGLKNTLSWVDLPEQTTYFLGKVKASFTELSYQRQKKSVKLPVPINNILECSYMMFQNNDFGGKWFYAFITDIVYVADGATEVFFEIDPIQTFYFDIDLKDSYIEREHVSNDSIGNHLVDEGLPLGEYKIRSTDSFLALNPLAIVVATTVEPDGAGGYNDVVGGSYAGVYSGAKLFGFDRVLGVTALNQFLADITTAGKADGIVSIFLMPKNLLPSFSDGDAIPQGVAQTLDFSYPKNFSDIDGYTPRNNKLFTYPFNFLYVTNHNGGVAGYRYEFSSSGVMEFYATSNQSPAPVVSLIPKNYKGAIVNFDEKLSLADYPLCSWTTDYFSNWIAQNAVSAPLSVASAGIALGVGAVTQNPIAVLGGGVSLLNSIGNINQAVIQPNQAKGSMGGGSNTSIGVQTYGFYPKTITAEYARMIDDFFQRFGYRVDRVATPNRRNRNHWTFIKTVNANIFGDVPITYLKKIRESFDNGITFWVDGIGNYNRVN